MFPHFPKIADLIASPVIRPFVDSLQPGPVIAAARSVFDEVHTEMRSVATEFRMPDVSELVARIAERLADQTRFAPRSVINATGILFHADATSIPLPAAALVEMVQRNGMAIDDAPLRTILHELTTAADAVVLANFVSAKMLVSASPLIVARSDVYEETLGDRLIDVYPPASLLEVGTVNKTTPDDYLRAIAQLPNECCASCVVYFASGAFSAGRFTLEPDEIRRVIDAARERGVRTAIELELATLVPLVAHGLAAVPQLAEVVALGSDLTIFRGGQLIGGPDVGVIVGRGEAVAQVREHPLYRSLRADAMSSAGLQATLNLYLQSGVLVETSVPVLELVSTSLDNLKNRAHRLAGQITGCAAVAIAEVVAGPAALTAARTLAVPSYQIEITLRNTTAEAWANSLRAATPSIVVRTIAREQAEIAVIDLRTVPASQDFLIVEACGE
ncbi:MAG: hypothetical protein ACRC46_05915 [Thermoguttaceae bacterium]